MSIKITIEVESIAAAVSALQRLGVPPPDRIEAPLPPPVASEPPKSRGRPRKLSAVLAAEPESVPAVDASSTPAPAPEAGSATATPPTKHELRAALVKLQSVKGKAVAMQILGKYASPATIDGCPEDKRAAAIAECQAAA